MDGSLEGWPKILYECEEEENDKAQKIQNKTGRTKSEIYSTKLVN